MRKFWFMALFAIGVGVPESQAQTVSADTGAAAKWGYGYAEMLKDLDVWRQSPFVTIDSIGASTQGRAIHMVTIAEGVVSDSQPRPRIFWHARTHPSEVQALRVANAGIAYLLDTTVEARELRRGHLFHFVPMYNPDGVETGRPRENARGIDLESNWNHPTPEAEVLVLRSQFEKLMATPSKIQVAINLHSDRFNCTRFFFYHDSAGTSPHYTALEKTFIGDVQHHFPEGIESWHFVKSWADGFKPQYPESWWWKNHAEKVMALTYEDANCPNASAFEQTAQALLQGSADFIARKGVAIRMARFTRAVTLSDAPRPWVIALRPLPNHNPGAVPSPGRRINALGRGL
jgi:hypothetical protein